MNAKLIFSSLFLLLTDSFSYSQKIIFQQKVKEKQFPYEYWFTLQQQDTLTISLTWNINETGNISYRITSNPSNLSTNELVLRPLYRKITPLFLKANSNGEFDFELDRFTTTFIIDLYNYQPITVSMQFNDTIKQMIYRSIPKENDEVFQINAKTKLTTTELNEIMQCVKKQLVNNAIIECKDPKRYTVSIQI